MNISKMGHNKKLTSEKFYEKDPFLTPLSNNNSTGMTCCDEKHKVQCTGILLPNSSQLVSSLLSISSSSISLVLGVTLILLGFICFIVSPQLESALTHLVQTWTALAGGPMLAAWLTPPIVPILKVYLFNITNPAEVLEGHDPITEEIGPYVYSATHIRRLIEVDDIGESLQFRNKNLYKFLPHLSVGSEDDPLTVLNMVMVTAFNKARHQPAFVKRGVVLPLLKSLGRSQPILNVTVGGFLFGYEDELACLGQFVTADSNDGGQNVNDDDDEWDNWDEEDQDDFFFKRKKRSVPNYRDPSGKCMWGVLKDLNNTEHETVRILTGRNDFKTKGRIVDLDGKTTFGAWKPECDSFKGSIEPSTLPAQLGTNFSILVPVMCRTLDMVTSHTHNIEGIPVTRYIADPASLHRDTCYCPDGDVSDTCLPSGYLNLEPCYPDMSPPLAVSFPHGLHSPPTPLLTHPPAPNTSEHTLYLDINNQLGVPLAVQVSFQLSAILRPDPSFPLLDQLNRTRLVPLFWASEGFSEPNSWMVSHTRMALGLPLTASLGCAGGFLGLGLCILVFTIWRRYRSCSYKCTIFTS